MKSLRERERERERETMTSAFADNEKLFRQLDVPKMKSHFLLVDVINIFVVDSVTRSWNKKLSN